MNQHIHFRNFKNARSILCIVLVVCYVVGMLYMLFGAFPIGLLLWVLSTVGGIAVLYSIRNAERKAAEAERLKKAAEGEDEETCE